MIDRMKELNEILLKASYEYYMLDKPSMTDKQYDALYDELESLEKETGIVFGNSVTQNVQGFVMDGFNKIKHSKPMLSAQKTKDQEEIKKFVGNKEFYGSWKLDGLTLVVIYNNGEFKLGITRGRGGIEGEDVTEQCKFIRNLPMKIPYDGRLELRGECLMTWDEFNRINSTLKEYERYKHPRNLASGTLRNLDLNVLKYRELSFVVFECVTDMNCDDKNEVLNIIERFGFETVDRMIAYPVDYIIETMKPENYKYPCDGLIFEINSNRISKSLGATSHHENARMALKWEDEVFETTVTDIDWTLGKSGIITPTCVFETVEIDGTDVSRASVYNVSRLTELDLNVGDTITVYKANMIIPTVHENLSAKHRESTYIKIPSKCPVCGGKAEIVQENDAKVLMCMNSDCDGKVLKKLCQFVSKDGMNIDRLSEQTLSFLLDRGWIKSYIDLYKVDCYRENWREYDGFGHKSVDNIIDAINKSTKTTLDKLLFAICIPNVGVSTARDIAKFCDYDIKKFIKLMDTPSQFKNNIDGVGDTIVKSLREFRKSGNWNNFHDLCQYYLTIIKPETNANADKLKGLTFVITGSVNKFDNRKALEKLIDDLGGKCSGSVSAKTSYLINNDKESSSSKNKKAQSLGIPIISEDDFLEMIK